MHYSDGTEVRLGDRIRFSNGDTGTVVFSIDTNEYSEEFPEKEWSYLEHGLMFRTFDNALIYLGREHEGSITLVERSISRKKTLLDEADLEWDSGNPKRALKLFKKVAAEEGDEVAFLTVGFFYDLGIGVKQDTDKAIFWYKKAARAGSASAYSNIGTVYRDRHNFEHARHWFLKAIEAGDGDANLELAKLYLNGKKHPDYTQAEKYLRMALESTSITVDSVEQAEALLRKIQTKS